jgi:hypothetical protein
MQAFADLLYCELTGLTDYRLFKQIYALPGRATVSHIEHAISFYQELFRVLRLAFCVDKLVAGFEVF